MLRYKVLKQSYTFASKVFLQLAVFGKKKATVNFNFDVAIFLKWTQSEMFSWNYSKILKLFFELLLISDSKI